jgi:hypothetical protein
MASGETDKIYATKVKHVGLFNLKEFYKFCYDWLMDEFGLNVFAEEKYAEQISGDAKKVEFKWKGLKKVTDYFRFDIKVEFRVLGMTNVEMMKDGKKISTNKGNIEMKVGGFLVKDYQGKFDKDSFRKFLRSIYDKWVIPSRIDQMEDKLAGDCDEFVTQVKAYLDLEGQR